MPSSTAKEGRSHDRRRPTSPEQQAEIGRIGAELEKWGKIDLVLLLLAVTSMATARYW